MVDYIKLINIWLTFSYSFLVYLNSMAWETKHEKTYGNFLL